MEDFLFHLGSVLGVPELSTEPDANLFNDLGVDSLGMVEMIFAIEDLGVDPEGEGFWQIRTPRDAYRVYLEKFDEGNLAQGNGAR